MLLCLDKARRAVSPFGTTGCSLTFSLQTWERYQSLHLTFDKNANKCKIRYRFIDLQRGNSDANVHFREQQELQLCSCRTTKGTKQWGLFWRQELVLGLHTAVVVMDNSSWPHGNIYVLLSARLDECKYLRAALLPAGKPSPGTQHQANLGVALGPVSEKPRLELWGSKVMLHLHTNVTLPIHTPRVDFWKYVLLGIKTSWRPAGNKVNHIAPGDSKVWTK